MKTRGKTRISIGLACMAAVLLFASVPHWIRGSIIPFPYGAALAGLALLLLVAAVKLTPPRGLRRPTPRDKQE